MPGMILGADVGGTKTLLGLFDRAGRRLRLRSHKSYASQESPSFQSIVDAFLAETGAKVGAFAIGVAGPVVGGRSQVVNLRWPIDAAKVARSLRLSHVHLLNDLEATAWGIPELTPRQMKSLAPGLKPQPGNAALIAAGTGLGTAILFQEPGGRLRPSAGEGGHQDFSARNDVEDALLRWLRRRHDHVSIERVVSGAGFSTIYEFLVDTARGTRTEAMRRRMEREDPNAAISEAALDGSDDTARRAAEILVSAYGAAAGDLALVAKATGGVYVGGGIAPKILPLLEQGDFLPAFRSKGRLSGLLEKIPVRVILEPRTALIGAGACAAHAAHPTRAKSRRGRSA
jgi:glucokinase